MAVIERFLKVLQLFCLHSLFMLNIFPAWMKGGVIAVTKSQS